MTAKELRQLVAFLEGVRSERLSQVEELGYYILPHRGLFSSDTKNTGKRRNERMVNNAPLRSLRRGAAGMTAGMTPASIPWFKHDFVDTTDRERTGARQWADAVDERISMVLSAGGFYQAIHEFNQELIGFGSALLYTESSPTTVAHYSCCTWGTWSVALNSQGQIESVARRVSFTAKEAIAKFGQDTLSRKIANFAQTKPYETCEFINVVMKRDSKGKHKEHNAAMPYASYWLEAGVDSIALESGYMEMPYAVAIWEKARTPYGTGPGDDALGDARQLDAMERRKVLGLDKIINPPITKPSAFKGRVNTFPGGETVVHSEMDRARLGPLYDMNFGTAVQYAQQEIQNVMSRVDDTLLATVFADSPIELRPAGITATEWAGRRRERLQMMGPTLAAYEPNVLNVVLERTYALLDRMGLTPEPPKDMGPMATLDVEYLSPLSQALRSTNGESIISFFSQIAAILQVDPATVDKLNTDQMIDELARANATPGSIVRSDEEVEAIREARAKAQEMAQKQQQEMAMMAQAKSLAETQVGEGTLAGAMMQGGA